MYILKNPELEIQILDPVNDRNFLGSRYCTGGYIYQVNDLKKGNLFSGPEFPNPNCSVFNGQGAPEVFVTALNDQCEAGKDVFVLGVGRVTRTSPINPFHVRDNPVVKEFCAWEINQYPDSIKMVSKIVFNQWNFIITKIITLNYRKIVSRTIFRNLSKNTIPILWYAHPFFPFPENLCACKITPQIDLSENAGYTINDYGYIALKKEYNWKKGLYQKIIYNSDDKLSVIQCHPFVENMSAECDFVPESIAIWSNDITFSFEPFYKKIIKEGEERSWGISYCF
jgi:hypothetical protein